jgi:hypothetical protein
MFLHTEKKLNSLNTRANEKMKVKSKASKIEQDKGCTMSNCTSEGMGSEKINWLIVYYQTLFSKP